MKTRNITKSVLAATAVAAILLVAQIAAAQGPGQGFGRGQGPRGGTPLCDGQGFGPGHGQGFMGPGMMERLGLTDEQQEAVAKIREEGRQDQVELRKQMMRLRNELEGEMLKDEPSESKVLDLTAKIGGIRTELQSNRVKHQLAIRKILTPEQRDQMLLMRKAGKHGRGGRGGFGRGGEGGWDRPCDGSGPGQGQGRGLGLGRQAD